MCPFCLALQTIFQDTQNLPSWLKSGLKYAIPFLSFREIFSAPRSTSLLYIWCLMHLVWYIPGAPLGRVESLSTPCSHELSMCCWNYSSQHLRYRYHNFGIQICIRRAGGLGIFSGNSPIKLGSVMSTKNPWWYYTPKSKSRRPIADTSTSDDTQIVSIWIHPRYQVFPR